MDTINSHNRRQLSARALVATGAFLGAALAGVLLFARTAQSEPTTPRPCAVDDDRLYCFAAGMPAVAAHVNSNFAELQAQIDGNFAELQDQIDVNAAASVPSGAVMAFNLAACPAGWRAADGTLGTPDLRDMFVRGKSDGRALGSFQEDAIGTHAHNFVEQANSCNSKDNGADHSNGFCRSGGRFDKARVTSPTGGAETRPVNVALLYCVKN